MESQHRQGRRHGGARRTKGVECRRGTRRRCGDASQPYSLRGNVRRAEPGSARRQNHHQLVFRLTREGPRGRGLGHRAGSCIRIGRIHVSGRRHLASAVVPPRQRTASAREGPRRTTQRAEPGALRRTRLRLLPGVLPSGTDPAASRHAVLRTGTGHGRTLRRRHRALCRIRGEVHGFDEGIPRTVRRGGQGRRRRGRRHAQNDGRRSPTHHRRQRGSRRRRNTFPCRTIDVAARHRRQR
ncbi:Uncharacterised protein [Mycobacteroides abscessus subsp. abscessus]|nr:Uncharacterised protein [Mycobacteroides abscessus subsp. abscessus]